ncbi:hypothetical protein ACLI1A_04305 [Flavobacterium sp. RHBU_3]|uniref:hypothetical protein n=1 Tax=Flavobacterium sp. RHBU_3 TaxID=3391184 RepID=UPI0039852D2B
MKTIDLYSKHYLGELETTIIEKDSSDEIIFELRLCYGDFGNIINWIPYNEEANPKSVVYLFNTDFSWGRDFTEILSLSEFYDQLITATNLVPSHPLDLPALDSLKEMCLSALHNGNKLFIKLSH